MTRYDAPVIALVVDVEDPEQLGRIKVKFPWLAADGTTTAWQRPGVLLHSRGR
jgi:uncharacterized protein involved in type VI secretion and phage assembly